jgi:hypothetical protein
MLIHHPPILLFTFQSDNFPIVSFTKNSACIYSYLVHPTCTINHILRSKCYVFLNTFFSALVIYVLLWQHETTEHIHKMIIFELNKQTNKQTKWPESASELYRPSDGRLSAKLVPIFADRGFFELNKNHN